MHAWDGQDLILDLHVQPRASRDEIVGVIGDRLNVRITAPPVDGNANQHLIAYLAIQFWVAKSDVVLIKGDTGREKRFRIRAPKHVPEAIPFGKQFDDLGLH